MSRGHLLAHQRFARRLLSLRQNGAWRTTQEDAWALLALADYRRLQESAAGGIEARASLGGSAILESKFPRGSLREDTSMVAADLLLAKGPTLSFDPKSERFIGERADEANKLISRDYRKPFVVPETV